MKGEKKKSGYRCLQKDIRTCSVISPPPVLFLGIDTLSWCSIFSVIYTPAFACVFIKVK